MVKIRDHISISLSTLSDIDRKRFDQFINIIKETNDLFAPPIKHRVKKIALSNNNFYVFALSRDLRILIKLDNQDIIIQDIIKRAKMELNFKKYLRGVR